MIGLNPILAGYSNSAITPRQVGGADPTNGQRSERPESTLPADRYTPGTQGRQAKARTDQTGGKCRCGSCPSCGVQAYQQQETARETSAAENKGVHVVFPDDEGAENAALGTVKGLDGEPLSTEELAQVSKLEKRDMEVRAHEQAHLSAAGGLAGSGMSFSFQKGPDGKSYAIGGEVQIDTSQGSTPRETISKMARVRAAALAPADPSPQDRKVAAAAANQMSQARAELQLEQSKETTGVVQDAAESLVQRKGESSGPAESESQEPEVSQVNPGRSGVQLAAYNRVANAAMPSGGQFSVNA